MFGRVRPGVTIAQVEQELTAICEELRRQFPAEYARKQGVRVTPLAGAIVGSHRSGITLLFASVLIVMAAALANLLCLVLARSHDRRPEISIRIALGASRLRLARQLTIEAGLLAAAGATLGVTLAAGVIAIAPAWAPASIPRLSESAIDARALAFGGALALTSAALIAAAAMATLLRMRGQLSLRPVGRTTGGDRWHRLVRDVLVAGEIASAVALLLATSLLLHDLSQLQRVDPGFDLEPVFQARVSLPATYRSPADVARFFDRLSERLAVLPGVRHVGLVSVAPLSGLLATVPVTVEGQPPAEAGLPNANLRAITPGYLDAAGTRLVRGRQFTAADRGGAPPVALVSAALADRVVGGEPIGRRLLIDDNNIGPRAVDIVGVVENVRQMTIAGSPTLDVYIPLHQIHPDGVPFVRHNQFWMLRTDGDPATLTPSFTRALQEVDRDAAISSVGTMRRYVDEWFAPLRFSLGLFATFSLTAVLLCVSGLYGLIAYTVSQRRREIGLRMALGASASRVRRLFLRHAAKLATAGIVTGLIGAFLARRLASLLTTQPVVDVRLIIGIAAGLFAVVLIAAWLPARRATRVAPTIALRAE
jgi:predicted permease